MSERIGVRALCVRRGQVLAIERHKNGERYLVIPGGGMESGETELQTAERETLEETTVAVRALKLILTIPARPDQGHSEQRVVICEYIEGEPVLDPESEDAQRSVEGENTYEPCWIDLDDAKLRIVPSELREYLNANL